MGWRLGHDYTCFREGAARYRMAMAGVPDRIPVFAQLHEFAMAQLGVPAQEFYTRPDLLVPGILEVQKRYGIDVPSVGFDVYNIEAEALGQKVVFPERSVPDIDRRQPLIREPSDLERIRTPDFERDGRFQFVCKVQSLFRELTGLEPTLNFCAPFTLAANLRGIERLLYDIYDAPQFARDLLERLTDLVLAPWIHFQKSHSPKAESICGVDAVASLPIVNPRILKDWVVPYILRLRELCGPGVYVANWVGESLLPRPSEMLELKLQVSPHFIEGQDPDVERLGPTIYKEFAQEHDVALVLGVGTSFLTHASPEEVDARVRAYAQVGGRAGRFVLYLCNLSAATPPENVRAAVRALQSVSISAF